jgi:hypothetical protein
MPSGASRSHNDATFSSEDLWIGEKSSAARSLVEDFE